MLRWNNKLKVNMPLEGHEKYKHTCCALPKGNEIVVGNKYSNRQTFKKRDMHTYLGSGGLLGFSLRGSS